MNAVGLIPSERQLHAFVDDAARDFSSGLRGQLRVMASDLRRGGFDEKHVRYVLGQLIIEIRCEASR